MEIRPCKRCDRDWCYRGAPVCRCGRCGSPYWNYERRVARPAPASRAHAVIDAVTATGGKVTTGTPDKGSEHRAATPVRKPPQPVRQAEPQAPVPARSSACPECGALRGLHQRGCSKHG